MLEEKAVELPEHIIQEMIGYLYSNGLVMKTKDLQSVMHVPVIITPTMIKKNLFEKAKFYQIAFNKMVDKMSRDTEFLTTALKP